MSCEQSLQLPTGLGLQMHIQQATGGGERGLVRSSNPQLYLKQHTAV